MNRCIIHTDLPDFNEQEERELKSDEGDSRNNEQNDIRDRFASSEQWSFWTKCSSMDSSIHEQA